MKKKHGIFTAWEIVHSWNNTSSPSFEKRDKHGNKWIQCRMHPIGMCYFCEDFCSLWIYYKGTKTGPHICKAASTPGTSSSISMLPDVQNCMQVIGEWPDSGHDGMVVIMEGSFYNNFVRLAVSGEFHSFITRNKWAWKQFPLKDSFEGPHRMHIGGGGG